jgi:very-long-chain ceramide synthase
LACAGYHVWNTWKHFTAKVKRNDYIEMALHHFLTLSLFVGGHMMGDIYSGLLIVYIMDFCDVWVHFAKGLCGTTWKKTTDFFGFAMWIFWFYTRLFCLPFCVYWMLFVYPFELPNMSGSYEGNLYYFKGSLLTLLGIMGIWWWYLISIVLFKAIFKGIQEDNQNKIE